MGNRLFVGNLAFQTTEVDLQDLFAAHGTVLEVKVVTDRDTGRSRGFGFVEMATPAEAEAAVKKFNGTELDGRTLKVEIAKAPGLGGGGPRGGGGGSRGGSSNRGRW